MEPLSSPEFPARVKVALRGAVQGVGFRPFVHRLATELGLAGWVNNSPQGVFLEAEGRRGVLEQFLRRLQTENPPRSFIQSCESAWLSPAGFTRFEIRPSDHGGRTSALVLPDIATCSDCLREMFDPADRRFHYPFINCTHCGPRFSILEALPYDRPNTTMKGFPMCPACQAEYDNPRDRRFHAQPNACPVCGPRLEFWNGAGDAVFWGYDALLAAANALRNGAIVAVKGIGGFHLLADAGDAPAVQRLRDRKQREEKPFALLFPDLPSIRLVCQTGALEERVLQSPAAPIVLLSRNVPAAGLPIVPEVAPGNPNLGIMLPANPLHHLLMARLERPVVATSGNLSDEPLCTDEQEARERLQGIADFFLVHNRPIARHVDDSIVRVVLGRETVLRRARGFAPLPVSLPEAPGQTVLAVGGHLKNSVALAVDRDVFVSQHIGDLETEPAHRAFRRVIADFERLYETRPQVIAADLHPDYLSTKYALARSVGGGPAAAQTLQVQHHVAHVLSCLAENEVPLPALGVAWDGTGYGTDGSIWGGEFFLVAEKSIERVASLRPFRLPGGEAAVKEPRRAALGLLHEMFGDAVFARQELAPVAGWSAAERTVLAKMLAQGLHSPWTSSVGRLFDGVAALLNLRQRTRFEGQAAMDLEFALGGNLCDKLYNLPLVRREALDILDWTPMIEEVLSDLQAGVTVARISAAFHEALAGAVLAVAQRRELARVALSGGCFQNRYLLERTVARLRANKIEPFWHQRVPPNDGGIALGQIAGAVRGPTKPFIVLG